jgi:hypothetical protein
MGWNAISLAFGSACLSLATALICPLRAQNAANADLPPNAVVIEQTRIPKKIHPNRELVLWMLSPERHDRGEFSGPSGYTCPEMTLGSYYSGPTRVSLVDTSNSMIINTLNLRYPLRKEDSFEIPYRILADHYYVVPGQERGTEGKPALLALRDLNGDGLALETAFFEAEACMGLQTTMIGYSPRQDRVVQYEVELKTKGEAKPEILTWVDYLFAEKPIRPGHWSYTIDYRGRLGGLNKYDVGYDRSREKFIGTLSASE